jgi:hypothetical protein
MGRNFGFFPFFKLMPLSTGLIIGIIVGLGLGIVILLPAALRRNKLNRAELQEYEYRKESAIIYLNQLHEDTIKADKERNDLYAQTMLLKKEMDDRHERIIELRTEEDNARKTLKALAETEEKIKSNMEKSIEQSSEALSKEYREAEIAHAREYELVMIDAAEDFTKEWNKKIQELRGVDEQIADKRKIYEAIVADERRKAKEVAERDFYRLSISEEDLNEVEKIREISPHLRNPEVLNKVLWTAYYQKPYQELVARLFNTDKPSGIYKITCLPDSRIYIGQSVNIPNRFSEHIKRGLGAEPATKNRLYTAMKKWGVENFTFEFVEEVPRDKLNERERYWIEFFQSAEFDVGLNGNKGVKE